MADQPAHLEREALGLTDVVFQGITHIAPALNVVFALPEIAAQARAAMPISLALSVVVCFFIANTVAQFSRYLPTSGGYYTFVSRGLGPRFGFVTTWSYLIYDIAGPAASIGFLGFATSSLVQNGTGVGIPWWIISLAATLIVWIITYVGIRISTHTTAILGAVEMLIIFALGVTCLVHPNPESSATAPLDPSMAPNGWGGVLGGMVFSILALSGFEAPAPLAQETKRPTRFIYLAIFTSLVIVGFFYIFMAYAVAMGWGTGNLAKFDSDDYDVLVTRLWGRAGRWLILFALFNSALGVGISCTNAAGRVVYTMAQTGTLPAALKKIHPIHKTPYMAAHVLQLLQIACFLLIGLVFGADRIFSCLGIIVSLAVILLYVLSNFALTIYIRREHAADFDPWRHGIVPVVGTLFLIPVTVVTVWPIPEYPQYLMPYIFVALMLAGSVVMIVLAARRPDLLPGALSVSDRPEEDDDVKGPR
jgi:amino acid transporter